MFAFENRELYYCYSVPKRDKPDHSEPPLPGKRGRMDSTLHAHKKKHNTPLSPLGRGVVATCAGASPKCSFVERGLVVDADSSGRSMLPSSEGRGFTQQMMNNRSMGYTGACQFHTRQAGLLADDDKISGARKPESKGMSVTCKRKHQRRQGKGASESLLFCYDAESLQTKWLQ